MFLGAPSPLLPSTLLSAVLTLAQPDEAMGVWLRGRRAAGIRAGRRFLLTSSDLGWLLRRCGRIAVRDQDGPVAVEARYLIAWRTLRIVTAAPYLPALTRLRLLLPELEIRGARLAVPIGLDHPEEALAACMSARVPVVASWVEYRR